MYIRSNRDDEDYSDSVINSGTVNVTVTHNTGEAATAGSAYGIYINNYYDPIINFVNEGNINVTATGINTNSKEVYGIYVADGDVSIKNTGKITLNIN